LSTLTPITVALVDDQALLRRGLRMMLDAEDDIRVVGEAATGADGVALAVATTPDVVLMDVRMPEMDGIQATARITAALATRVIVLTTFDLDEHVVDALRAGASGFLLKDALPDDIVAAVRVVAAGDALLAPSVTRRMLDHLAAAAGPPLVPDGIGRLTDREHEVLLLVAEGLSNAEIGARLYVSEATVKTHVGRMLTKLGLRDRVQAVVLAYECKLVQPGRRPPAR
jgi:DNA-binding NarL/FixJ family response regulator